MANPAPIWKVRLICCGRDDGTEQFSTWGEADAFRCSYTRGPGVADPTQPWRGGHDRAAIIERAGVAL